MILQKPKFLRSHPSVTIKPTAPAPRFESSGCSPNGALGERNANCSHNLKVANPSTLSGTLPFLGGATQSVAGGMGLKSGTLFSRPPNGVQGQRPSHIVGRRGPRPCKAPEGDRSPPSTYTPKRTKSCIPTCNSGKKKTKRESLLAFLPALCYTLFKHLSKY